MLSKPGTIRIADGRSVVFSFWRAALDRTCEALMAANMTFSRIDGTMSHRVRALAVEDFRTNPNVKVLLATVSTAGVGLD